MLDEAGRLLGDAEFVADAGGYRSLLGWLQSFGQVGAIGVEGTGTYGAGLARYLTSHRVRVVEVDRPDRRTRRAQGKSDSVEAIAAARAVLGGTATGTPKLRTGRVEAIRALRIARRGAVKARVAGLNQLHGLVASAPEALRAELVDLTRTALIRRCAGFRTDQSRLAEPEQATRTALRAIARRIQALNEEITTADRQIAAAVATIAPTTMCLDGIGPQVCAQLVVTAGDNPERLRDEAATAAATDTPTTRYTPSS